MDFRMHLNIQASFAMLSLLLLCFISLSSCAKSKYLITLNDENWKDMLKGEWMINFHSKAAWCSACKEMERPWNAFADWSSMLKKRSLKVAQIDVTQNPGLSGRFLVTGLPTIYHVKDGVFRLYSGTKDKSDFVKFYKDKKWSTVEILPSYYYPDSVQMSMVASLFKFSMRARDFHTHLVETKGLPSLFSFAIFGSATLVIGCILGFIMVMIIDRFVPNGGKSAKKNMAGKKDKEKKETKANQNLASANKSEKNGATKNTAKNGLPNGASTENGHIKSKSDNQKSESKKIDKKKD